MKNYLILLAAVLITVGLLGFIGVIGPTHEHSPWGGKWYFDTVENIGHTLVGLISLWAAFKASPKTQLWFVKAAGIAGILAGLYSLLIANKILGANFQNPSDTLFHLVIGLLAWATYFRQTKNWPKPVYSISTRD